jgi:hypothetical protein
MFFKSDEIGFSMSLAFIVIHDSIGAQDKVDALEIGC